MTRYHLASLDKRVTQALRSVSLLIAGFSPSDSWYLASLLSPIQALSYGKAFQSLKGLGNRDVLSSKRMVLKRGQNIAQKESPERGPGQSID